MRERHWRGDEYDDLDRYVRRPPPRHSVCGVLSFILACGLGACLFILMVLAGAMEATTPGGVGEDSPVVILVGLFGLGCMGGAVLGIVLGVIGLVEADRQRIFAILGVVGNAVLVLGVLGLMLVGMATS